MQNILIVDDDRELRALVSDVLVNNGFRVSVAGNGTAMTQRLATTRVDLIILDILMPGEEGLSLCRRLRANGTIPIIMLTARGSEIDRILGLEMGADDYLPKPFSTRGSLLASALYCVAQPCHHQARRPVQAASSSSPAGALM
jgi:two-component system, OmpR family, response regulator